MPKEIERKFLVSSNDFKIGATSEDIIQGYLTMDEDKVIRIRSKNNSAFISIKSKVTDITRMEYEYPIPVDEAKEILENICIKPLIIKKRYIKKHEGKTWEIDVFYGTNQGLIIAEIELNKEKESFLKPGWIGKEVTNDPRYYNFNLVNRPYSKWGK